MLAEGLFVSTIAATLPLIPINVKEIPASIRPLVGAGAAQNVSASRIKAGQMLLLAPARLLLDPFVTMR